MPKPIKSTKIVKRITGSGRPAILCFSMNIKYNRKKAKSLVKKLVSEGHEIASHGYSHDHRYNLMHEDKAIDYLKKSRKYLETISKSKILGLRAPQMSKPSFGAIEKAGYLYDSSLHPTWVPGRYNNFFKKRGIYKSDDVIEVPVSVVPLIRAPFSWLWFRLMPLYYSKIATAISLMDQNFVNIYFHPCEFIYLKKYERLSFIRRKNTGRNLIKKIEGYLVWTRQKGYKSVTIRDYLKTIGIIK